MQGNGHSWAILELWDCNVLHLLNITVGNLRCQEMKRKNINRVSTSVDEMYIYLSTFFVSSRNAEHNYVLCSNKFIMMMMMTLALEIIRGFYLGEPLSRNNQWIPSPRRRTTTATFVRTLLYKKHIQHACQYGSWGAEGNRLLLIIVEDYASLFREGIPLVFFRLWYAF